MDKKELNAYKLRPFQKEMQAFMSYKMPLPLGFLFSIVLMAIAIKIQFSLQPKVGSVIIIAMYPVVICTAWIAGTYVGLFTICLSIFSAIYFFIAPHLETGIIDPPNVIRLCLFSLTNLFAIFIISRMRKAEEKSMDLYRKISESDSQYRAIVELSPHIIWYSNDKGESTYLNHTWEEYSGLKAEDSLATWCEEIHPEDYDHVMDSWKSCIKTLSRFEMHMRLKRHDGEYRWFFARGKPIINPEGQVVQWIGKAVDFHEQKLAIESKNEFISLASHELKTPLTSLSLQLQILDKNIQNKNEKILNFESLEKLSKISLTQVNQINHLIEDMLNVSRIGEGKIPYQISEVDINDLIDNATQIVSAHFIDAKIPLNISIQEKMSVPADQRKLVQVLVNLLINALKYGNNTPVAITVSKVTNRSMAKIEVSDSGHGISKDNQQKIFERFVQINTYGKNAGLGLGLYLSKEIVTAHSGSIFVESEPGLGARFVIELPLTSTL